MLRLCRVYLQLLPKVPHINPEIVTLLGVGRAPYIAKQLLVRDHSPDIRNQNRKQSVLYGCEMNLGASAANNSFKSIDFNFTKSKNRVCLSDGLTLRLSCNCSWSTQICTHTRHQFTQSKGLGQIVISTSV